SASGVARLSREVQHRAAEVDTAARACLLKRDLSRLRTLAQRVPVYSQMLSGGGQREPFVTAGRHAGGDHSRGHPIGDKVDEVGERAVALGRHCSAPPPWLTRDARPEYRPTRSKDPASWLG